jgi:hypothetical protein
VQILKQGWARQKRVLHKAEPGEVQAQDGQRSYRQAAANCFGKQSLVMGDVQVPIAEKKAVEESVVPLCQDNKYTICAAEDDDASPSRRPFIKFHLQKKCNVTNADHNGTVRHRSFR